MWRRALIMAFPVGVLSAAVILRSDLDLSFSREPFDNLIVSGQPSLAQLESLSQAGLTTVVNLRRRGEFDDFDEAAVVTRLGMDYVNIPVKDVESITASDARALHEAISNASGPVLLHCTVGWRAGGLLAIERFLFHGASRDEALEIAAAAHMSHLRGDVEAWIEAND